MIIKETIVVEGRDDFINLRRVIESDIITTNGYGLNKKIIDRIRFAYKKNNIIIFTDPDSAGDRIRKRLTEMFPNAKHAFLSVEEALKDGDIGIENASKEAILDALSRVRTKVDREAIFTKKDLYLHGLIGLDNSSKLRNKVGRILGIGYGNSNQFLLRLNSYGITKEELMSALEKANGLSE